MKKLNPDTWKRKEHFEFFSAFDEPFFGIVTEIDSTLALAHAKENRYSFWSSYLHKSLMAVNDTEEFHYRIADGEVVVYDAIHASPTLGRKDGTFGFGFVTYHPAFGTFHNNLSVENARIQTFEGLGVNENTQRLDTIHYTSLPWIHFTGMSHACHFGYRDSVPKIAFGKAVSHNGRTTMPLSVHVHHGLMDGLHVARFVERFEYLMNNELQTL